MFLVIMIYQSFTFTVWGKNYSVIFVYNIHMFNFCTRICHFSYSKIHDFNIQRSINIMFLKKCFILFISFPFSIYPANIVIYNIISRCIVSCWYRTRASIKTFIGKFLTKEAFCQPFCRIFIFSIWHMMHSLLLYGSDGDLLNIGCLSFSNWLPWLPYHYLNYRNVSQFFLFRLNLNMFYIIAFMVIKSILVSDIDHWDIFNCQ